MRLSKEPLETLSCKKLLGVLSFHQLPLLLPHSGELYESSRVIFMSRCMHYTAAFLKHEKIYLLASKLSEYDHRIHQLIEA